MGHGIREELTRIPKLARVFTVELSDRAGLVHAVIEKTVHVSRREAVRTELTPAGGPQLRC